MAKKQQSSPPQPPSVTPERGIELLRRQRREGEQELSLLGRIPEYAGNPWYNTTIAFLLECFGLDSQPAELRVGWSSQSVKEVTQPEEWYEQHRAEVCWERD